PAPCTTTSNASSPVPPNRARRRSSPKSRPVLRSKTIMRKLICLLLFAQLANAQSADAIRAHMRFLASDALEGRGTGTRGYAVAADYVAAQFRSYGLDAQFQPI